MHQDPDLSRVVNHRLHLVEDLSELFFTDLITNFVPEDVSSASIELLVDPFNCQFFNQSRMRTVTSHSVGI